MKDVEAYQSSFWVFIIQDVTGAGPLTGMDSKQ